MRTLVIVFALFAGCAGTDQFAAKAAFEMACDEARLQLTDLGDNTWGVSGCGKRQTYQKVCGVNGLLPNGAGGFVATKHCQWVGSGVVSAGGPTAAPLVPPAPAKEPERHSDLEQCERGTGNACMREAKFADTKTERLRLWTRACDGGNAEGCMRAGFAHGRGEDAPKDLALARKLLQRGCDAKDALSCRYLADTLFESDPLDAILPFLWACAYDDAWSCWRAGGLYAGDRLGAPNKEHAVGFYRRACKLGMSEACNALK